jgi:U4/U6.U5 tri-snRNP-associated protein 3
VRGGGGATTKTSSSSSSSSIRGGIDRERLELERRERMARLRADDGREDGSGDAVASSSSTASSMSTARGVKIAAKRRRVDDGARSNGDDGDDDDEDTVDDERRRMMDLLGFGGFGTTKGKAVMDNQTSAARGAVSKNKGRKYRQYMNRKGGFNRPLDKMN